MQCVEVKGVIEDLLPGVVAQEKHIVLPVDKYKLPAWSQRVIQLSFEAK